MAERVALTCPGCHGSSGTHWDREHCPVCTGTGLVEKRIPGRVERLLLRAIGGSALAAFWVVSLVVIVFIAFAYAAEIWAAFG